LIQGGDLEKQISVLIEAYASVEQKDTISNDEVAPAESFVSVSQEVKEPSKVSNEARLLVTEIRVEYEK